MRRFRKASRCVSGECVYVAILRDTVLIRRDRRDGPTLEFTFAEFVEFTDAVRRGEFDLPGQHDQPTNLAG